MPRHGPRRLPAGERDRRLAEEVLYLHSLWRGGGLAPAPIQPLSDRRAKPERLIRLEERGALWGRLDRALRRKERKRRKIGHTPAAEPSLAPPPPASPREALAEAAGASAPSTANPPPPTTPPGPPAQREAWVEFSNRDSAADYDDCSDSDRDKEEEEEAARYFSGLFERDAWLRGHYTLRWCKGPFPCMVCAAGVGMGNSTRQFRGCLALVQHARNPPRSRGRHGAHRALAAVICRLLGWDVETGALPRVVIDPRATAGVQHAKENDGAGENNGYSIDEDEEEDVETGMTDPGTTSDEDDREIESNEEYAEKEDADTGGEGSKITDGDKEAIEQDNCVKIPEKEAANSIARKHDMKIRDRLLSLTHAKLVGTPPKNKSVWKRSHVPKHKEVLIPSIKFNEGSDKAKRKASALSYQGLKSKHIWCCEEGESEPATHKQMEAE